MIKPRVHGVLDAACAGYDDRLCGHDCSLHPDCGQKLRLQMMVLKLTPSMGKGAFAPCPSSIGRLMLNGGQAFAMPTLRRPTPPRSWSGPGTSAAPARTA